MLTPCVWPWSQKATQASLQSSSRRWECEVCRYVALPLLQTAKMMTKLTQDGPCPATWYGALSEERWLCRWKSFGLWIRSCCMR